jgi:hypothetical protein
LAGRAGEGSSVGLEEFRRQNYQTVWHTLQHHIAIVMAGGTNHTGGFQIISMNMLGVECLPRAQQYSGKQRQPADSLMITERRDHIW